MNYIEPEMVLIPEGKVHLGLPSYSKSFNLPHQWQDSIIYVPDFYISRFPITRKEYSLFIEDGGDIPADWWRKDLTDNKLPATGLSWHMANRYAEWLSEITGKRYRLPSSVEWEKAARGGLYGKRFPWGDESANNRCCYGLQEFDTPSPVGYYEPNGYELYDMVGNVWEWCSDLYIECANDEPKNSPTGKDPKINRVLRGGSFMTPDEKYLYCAYIHEDPPDLAHVCLGMRLALSS